MKSVRPSLCTWLDLRDEWGDGSKQLNSHCIEHTKWIFCIEKFHRIHSTWNPAHVISKEKNTFTNDEDYQRYAQWTAQSIKIINHHLHVFTEALYCKAGSYYTRLVQDNKQQHAKMWMHARQSWSSSVVMLLVFL